MEGLVSHRPEGHSTTVGSCQPLPCPTLPDDDTVRSAVAVEDPARSRKLLLIMLVACERTLARIILRRGVRDVSDTRGKFRLEKSTDDWEIGGGKSVGVPDIGCGRENISNVSKIDMNRVGREGFIDSTDCFWFQLESELESLTASRRDPQSGKPNEATSRNGGCFLGQVWWSTGWGRSAQD